jgi:hypothetical protein
MLQTGVSRYCERDDYKGYPPTFGGGRNDGIYLSPNIGPNLDEN